MTLVLPHEAAFARELRREMSSDLVWFTQHYFRDEDGAPFRLKDFHIEMLRACADPDIERLLLLEPAGFGKCVDPMTPILMASGELRPAALVRPGDLLSLGRCLGSWSNGERPCLEIRTDTGQRLVVTEDHPFMVNEDWVSAKDLQLGVSLMLLGPWEAPGSMLLDEAFRFVGYMIGDGTVTRQNCSFTTTDPEVLDDFRRSAKALGYRVENTPKHGRISYRVSGGSGRKQEGGPREFLRHLGLYGKDSHTKRVPTEIMRGNKRQIEHFLACYYACDGGYASGSVEFYSVSEGLLRDVQHLLLRLDIVAKLSVKNGRYAGARHVSSRLRVASSDWDKLAGWPHPLPRKIPTAIAGRSRRYEPTVVGIRQLPDRPTWALEVEGGMHHTADVLTHNTTHVGKHYPIWLVCLDPNCQIIYASKNADDAAARLAAIKAELEGNDALISDFGPFVGRLWRDDSIEVARRGIRVKDPTIAAIGSTSSIYGKRATHFIGDDMVTLQNSGPQVEPKTRERLKRDYNDGIKKVGYTNKRLYIRLVNTVVDQRDLIHDLGDINQRRPEDVRWVSSKRYHVIRRPSLDERSMTSLWPERRSVASLLEEKAEDVLSFLRRMQNLCMDPLTMPFQRVWFDGDPADPLVPGCLDHSRCLNEDPRGEGLSLAKTGGFDPNPGTSENSKYSAYTELAFDKRAAEPRTYWVTDLVRFRAQIEEQATFCAERAAQRGLALLNIEDNAANQWLLQVNVLRTAALSHRIQGFNTNVRNKYDPEVGVPAIAGRLRAGRIRFPYHCQMCRERTETIIGEFLAYPQGATSDMLMSLWFALLAAEQFVRTTNNRVIDPSNSIVTSPWVANRGITSDAVERWLPTRVVN